MANKTCNFLLEYVQDWWTKAQVLNAVQELINLNLLTKNKYCNTFYVGIDNVFSHFPPDESLYDVIFGLFQSIYLKLGKL